MSLLKQVMIVVALIGFTNVALAEKTCSDVGNEAFNRVAVSEGTMVGIIVNRLEAKDAFNAAFCDCAKSRELSSALGVHMSTRGPVYCD